MADRIYTRDELEKGQIVLFHKPAGWTSFDVVNKLRRLTRVKKVGHAGTLDPFATGLLLICFGKATKKVEQLMGLEKEYLGTILLGAETDTHDITGRPTKNTDIPADLDEDRIEEILSRFRGEIEQIPPMFSALKHKGKKLYNLARKGEVVQRQARSITIYHLELLAFYNNELRLKIRCSRGTYIRALARDIGREAGCGAHLKSLTRTQIGSYKLDDAWNIDQFADNYKANIAHGRLQQLGQYKNRP